MEYLPPIERILSACKTYRIYIQNEEEEIN